MRRYPELSKYADVLSDTTSENSDTVVIQQENEQQLPEAKYLEIQIPSNAVQTGGTATHENNPDTGVQITPKYDRLRQIFQNRRSRDGNDPETKNRLERLEVIADQFQNYM
jgi:hypothetical protein